MYSITNQGASKEAGEPAHAGNSGGKSIWYKWVAPKTAWFTFDTITTQRDYNTLLGIYTANNPTRPSVSALTQVAADDDFFASLSRVRFRATQNTTYYIAVDGRDGNFGNANLRWTFATFGPNFDGDGDTDVAVFRPASGYWFVQGGSTTQFGASGDLPVPGDYDGDGDTDVAVFRPASGYWFVQGGSTTQFRTSGDLPVPGDYDGDGDTDIAVYRPSNGYWFVQGGDTVQFGISGDIPVVADWNGDTKADMGIFRPSSGTWFLRESFQTPVYQFGSNGDVPVPTDLFGFGATQTVVFRPTPGVWFTVNGSDAFGANGDIPVPGDYNADGKEERALFRPGNGYWFVRFGATTQFGASGDIPLSLAPAILKSSFPSLFP